MKSARRVGRPKATQDDKQQAILAISSHLFATVGYEKTTIRLVAQKAGVDPKLVMHYFQTKQKLFVACMKVPVEAQAAIALTKTLPKSKWGWAIAEIVWEIQSSPNHPLISLMRAASSDEGAAQMTRDFYLQSFLDGFTKALEIDNRELRLIMVSSFVSGYTFTNKILGIFDGAKISDSKRKELFAVTIQRILTAPL